MLPRYIFHNLGRVASITPPANRTVLGLIVSWCHHILNLEGGEGILTSIRGAVTCAGRRSHLWVRALPLVRRMTFITSLRLDGCICCPQDDRITATLWLCCSVVAALVDRPEKKDKSYVCPSNSSA
jgi:hypothetical protein